MHGCCTLLFFGEWGLYCGLILNWIVSFCGVYLGELICGFVVSKRGLLCRVVYCRLGVCVVSCRGWSGVAIVDFGL